MDEFEKLRFGRGGITDDTDVDVTAETHSLGGGFVYAAEEHEEDAAFDFHVAKGCGCYGFGQLWCKQMNE